MANDNWRTPREIFEKLDLEFKFVADMACTMENKLCYIGFGKQFDSLRFNWKKEVDEAKEEENINNNFNFVFCNPPYSDPMPWIKKAVEAQYNGLGVVMLLNADTSVAWFAEAVKFVSEIRFIIADDAPETKRGYKSGRIAFINDKNEAVSGNSKPQFILVFDPFRIGWAITRYVKKSDLF